MVEVKNYYEKTAHQNSTNSILINIAIIFVYALQILFRDPLLSFILNKIHVYIVCEQRKNMTMNCSTKNIYYNYI